MLRLTTLGRVALTGAGDPSVPHPLLGQPKRLALLAHLVVAYPGTLAFRDGLLPLLWPEHHEPRARRALRQTLYHLRKELGDDVIIGGPGRVGVDPARLWCDAVAFERAVAEDELETAVELYSGEFMAGFHPGSGPECQHWLDGARERLRRKAVAAASALADRAETKGDYDRAIEYARWLLGVTPADERAARGLIRLLASTGDRVAALEVYQALGSHLREELDLEPDADTLALLEAVRTGAVDRPADRSAGRPVTSDHVAGGRHDPLREHSLAVLPFASLSGDASEKVFAGGLTEMLITELARQTSVAIVSRTSANSHGDGTRSLSAAARELGVDRVVEGTVQKWDDRVRVTAQLLTTPPERHIWADSFEREIVDPLAAQAELAQVMARAIETALGEAPIDRPRSVSADARDAYFRGRSQFVRMTPSAFLEAASQFQEAIRLDPGFAQAHASLAYAQAVLARSGRIAPLDAYPRARRRAEQALALDPQLPEAHLALGACATLFDRDWDLAERHIRRGLRRGPDLPDSYWMWSNLLLITGRREEARRAARRARELDPIAPTLWLNEVLIQVSTGKARAAMESAGQFAAFHRDSSASAFALGMAREINGDHREAARSFAQAAALGGGPHSIAAQGHNLVKAGRPEPARKLLAGLLAIDDRYVPPTSIARIHAALGEADEAFRWLDRAAAVRDDWILFIDGWPRFEPIRDDARFDSLRRHIGLPTVGA